MKTLSMAVVAIGVLCCSVMFGQQQRALKIVATDPTTGEQLEVYQNTRAILVGINQYRFVTPLNYAVADAESIKSLLIRKFKFMRENIRVLTDAKATKKGIMDAFAGLLETSTDDGIIVFYAGHGTQIDLPGGGEMGYLVPVDGMTKSKSELYSTCISMEEIKNISKQIPAKHVLFLIDACYGGLAATTSRALTQETKRYVQKISAAQARQIITAGGRGEVAVEKAEWGHSAFTKALLDGLDKELADFDGNGLITASELAAYLKPRVTASSENRQTPQIKSFTDDEGDFILVTGRKPVVSQKPIALEEIEKREEEPAESKPQSMQGAIPPSRTQGLKFSGALSLPIGAFGSTTADDGGLAKVGFGAGVEYGHGFSENFGLAVSANLSNHGIDLTDWKNLFPAGTNLDGGSWLLIWVLAGPTAGVSVGTEHRLYATGFAGLLFGSSPKITAENSGIIVTQAAASATAFGFGFGVGFTISNQFDVNLRYARGDPEYKTKIESNVDTSEDVSLKQPTSTLLVSLGYIVRW